ncbi:MAG: S1 RNA-binding domain-containing protein, partial [Planctomycetaceae bacterium]|nr:S1 RNA-binding domain-containing protein [Planctomycetaceae bacterium]
QVSPSDSQAPPVDTETAAASPEAPAVPEPAAVETTAVETTKPEESAVDTAAPGEPMAPPETPVGEALTTESPATVAPSLAETHSEESVSAAQSEPAAPVDKPVASGTSVEPAATPAEVRPAEASLSEQAGDASQPEEAKKKIQLNPTVSDDKARPVPTHGSSENYIPEPTGPVAIPKKSDDDIEAEIAKAVSGIKPEEMESAPVEDKEAIAVPLAESLDATIEAAIEAAIGAGDLAGTGDQTDESTSNDPDSLRQGQKLTGTVQSVHGDNIFLDFGMRLSGVVPARQFDTKNLPKEGDTLEVVFDRVDEEESLILTNRPRGTAKIQGGDYSQVTMGDVVECMVTKTNKGGLEVTVSSLRAFMPASQVDLGYIEDLETFVGQKLRAKITEVKPAKRKLVLSRRALLLEERAIAKKELMEELKPDQVRTGRVKTIKEYGAFIDLGGVDGFLPISQMSWVRIESPNELLSQGQEVEVKVLSIDREKDRISLGMRQLAPNPWKLAESKYAQGSTVTGRVTKVEPFGAFVELEPGIEGLVHISELDHRRVKRVTEVLNVGDMADVQILEVDPAKKRVSLSVKALKAKPEPEEPPKDEDLAPGKGQAYQRKQSGPLKGGIGGPSKGGLFGNPNDFS